MYERTAAWKQGDFTNARQWEEELGVHLGEHKIGQLDSTTELDWWVPGCYIDQKEKRQPISKRWPRWADLEEVDAFILDELSVRRAMTKSPTSAYFLIRDVPGGNRIFLAPIYEVIGVERIRLQRGGKGKWVVDLRNFRQLNDLAEVLPTILADQAATPWKRSDCLTQREVPQV